MFATPFLLIGYEFKQSCFLNKLNWKICLGCLVTFLLCLGLGKSRITFVTASMDDFIISLLSGLSSSLVVLFCARKLEICKPLAWLGRHSLICLCVHLFELETMGSWFSNFFKALSLPYTELTRFFMELIFITAVTSLILFLQKKVHFKTTANMAVKPTGRDTSVDIARGILIVLMLIGHFSVEENFRSMIYSFHMMAFVFLSGYFFKQSDTENIPKTLGKLIRTFLIPYTLFAVLAIFILKSMNIETALLGISYTKNLFTDTASVGPVCFILMLFLVRVIYLFIEKYSVNEYCKAGICLVVSLGGVWLGLNGYWLPWSLDCAMFSIIFYYLGHCFYKYGWLDYFKNNLITYFALSIVWAYMIYSGGMELAVRNYGSYGITILGALSGTVLLYMTSSYINDTLPYWISNLMRLAGESTIYILIIHALFNGRIQSFVEMRFTRGYIYHMVTSIIIQVFLGIALYVIINCVKTILTHKNLQFQKNG